MVDLNKLCREIRTNWNTCKTAFDMAGDFVALAGAFECRGKEIEKLKKELEDARNEVQRNIDEPEVSEFAIEVGQTRAELMAEIERLKSLNAELEGRCQSYSEMLHDKNIEIGGLRMQLQECVKEMGKMADEFEKFTASIQKKTPQSLQPPTPGTVISDGSGNPIGVAAGGEKPEVFNVRFVSYEPPAKDEIPGNWIHFKLKPIPRFNPVQESSGKFNDVQTSGTIEFGTLPAGVEIAFQKVRAVYPRSVIEFRYAVKEFVYHVVDSQTNSSISDEFSTIADAWKDAANRLQTRKDEEQVDVANDQNLSDETPARAIETVRLKYPKASISSSSIGNYRVVRDPDEDEPCVISDLVCTSIGDAWITAASKIVPSEAEIFVKSTHSSAECVKAGVKKYAVRISMTDGSHGHFPPKDTPEEAWSCAKRAIEVFTAEVLRNSVKVEEKKEETK